MSVYIFLGPKGYFVNNFRYVLKNITTMVAGKQKTLKQEPKNIKRLELSKKGGDSMTGLHVLDESLMKTNAWLNDVKNAGGYEDKEAAWKAFGAVIQTLRDRLPVNEATDLGAQLPMILKGLYYHNWNPAVTPVKEHLQQKFVRSVGEKLSKKMDPAKATGAVMATLQRHVSYGELQDINTNLSKDVSRLWGVV